jgi:G:T/U-mismatch repair DNA glycosylase
MAFSRTFYFRFSVFWWIAGDCLGFRRDTGVSPSSGKEYALCQHLQYGADRILTYPQQVLHFTHRGYALWDIIQSCTRPGSLDTDISNSIPNDIPAWCRAHSTIRRIVISNGSDAAKRFVQHFSNWISTGLCDDEIDSENEQDKISFVAHPHALSQAAFGSILSKRAKSQQDDKPNGSATTPMRTIELIVAVSPSPAAASISYDRKRDFWRDHVYSGQTSVS